MKTLFRFSLLFLLWLPLGSFAQPAFSFSPDTISTPEVVGPITFLVGLDTPLPVPTSIAINLSPAGTATDGADFTNWNDVVLNFPPNVPGPFQLSLFLNDDNLAEPTETIILTLNDPTGGAVLGDSVLTITILDDDYAFYSIADITDDTDGDGEIAGTGFLAELRGIVHGANRALGSSGRLNFALIDNTGGISVYSERDFGYMPHPGDDLVIRGMLNSDRGLAQIVPDTLFFLSSGNPLVMPLEVDSLGEYTEAEYLRLRCFRFVDPSQWPDSGTARLLITNGLDTLHLRIDSTTELAGAPRPAQPFDVVGLGWQVDETAPRTEGYEFLPSFVSDFDSLPDPEVDFRVDTLWVAEGEGRVPIPLDFGPGDGLSYRATLSYVPLDSTATPGLDFALDSSLLLVFAGCGRDSGRFGITLLEDVEVEENEFARLRLHLLADSVRIDSADLTIGIRDNDFVGFTSLPPSFIRMYPNPASEGVSLRSPLPMEQVRVCEPRGKQVLRKAQAGREIELSVGALPPGLYFVEVTTQLGTWTAKLICE